MLKDNGMEAFTAVVKKVVKNGWQRAVLDYIYKFHWNFQPFYSVKEKHNEEDALNEDITKVI